MPARRAAGTGATAASSTASAALPLPAAAATIAVASVGGDNRKHIQPCFIERFNAPIDRAHFIQQFIAIGDLRVVNFYHVSK
jgi:hypothetical protein